ncbi:MAG: hypothetical protein RLZZ60_1759 [Bacteroidota bacterium]|jgi:hypothetical protein
MKSAFLKSSLIALAFIVVLCSAIMNLSGPGAGYSNAPGDFNCTSCHTSSIITSNNSNLNNIRLNGNFTGNGYIPDSTYSMELTFKQTGKVKYGFQITCLDKTGSPAGTFTSTTSRTSKVTRVYNSKTREYIQHTTTGTSTVGTDSTRWVFTWKAPTSNIGNLTFYMVVMAANNNGTDDNGDIVYAKTLVLPPSSLLPSAVATSNDTLTCTGYNVQLNGVGTNSPTAYNWNIIGGTPSTSTLQNPTVTFSTTGAKMAILSVRNNKGVSFPDTINFVVNQTPTATILNGSSGAICKGDSLNLTAGFVSGATYLWLNNNKTLRSIYVKDTGSYKVKVSNALTKCNATSLPFKLTVNPLPTINLTRVSVKDSVCQQVNESITANGTNIDSVLWYINGKLSYRTKSLTLPVLSSTSLTVYAIAKSVNNCKSMMSNQLNFIVVPKVYPKSIVIQKTTSSITLQWRNSSAVKSMQYSIDNSNFNPCSTDSTLLLTGLSANTLYRITLRSIQQGPCVQTDSVLLVRTNLCSNLSYNLSYNARICKASTIVVKAHQLKGKYYSISWNNGPFKQDTLFSQLASQNDSIRFELKDSSSLNCPSIVEYVKYSVDTLLDNQLFSSKSVFSCDSSLQLNLPFAYDSCVYYLNNQVVYRGGNQHLFKQLNSGSQIKVMAYNQTCVKTYASWNYQPYPAVNPSISIVKNWKFYDFSADTSNAIQHQWRINGVLVSTNNAFTYNMTPYIGDTLSISHKAISRYACDDSSSVKCIVNDFTQLLSNAFNPIVIFPNPVSHQLTINGISETMTISLLSIQGQSLGLWKVSENSYQIDCSVYQPGMYVLRFENESGAKMQRVIQIQ